MINGEAKDKLKRKAGTVCHHTLHYGHFAYFGAIVFQQHEIYLVAAGAIFLVMCLAVLLALPEA